MSECDIAHSTVLRKRLNEFEFLDEHIENYTVEASALHRKLQSKGEALRILRKELEKFRTERDQFKLMAETLQLRYSTVNQLTDLSRYNDNSSVASLLHQTREQNIKLTTEVESLKQKLTEVQGDVEILRSKDEKHKCTKQCSEYIRSDEEIKWKVERSSIINYLEALKKKNAQLAFDLKALIDEKHDLVTERDAFKCKAHRLNHELLIALKTTETHPKALDVDSILLENNYLHECLKNYENELEISKQTVDKYKTILESKRKKGIIKLGTNSDEDNILSHKQVKEILENGIDLPSKTETIQDLKSLCLALLDNLNDKNLALNHQKQTNKVLATKISELESRVQCLTGLETNNFYSGKYQPSQFLLHGYSASTVDLSVANEVDNISSSKLDSDSKDITLFGEKENLNKIFGEIEDTCSMSAESSASALSSEYEIIPHSNNQLQLSILHNFDIDATNMQYSNEIGKERLESLKDLPIELASMVEKALNDLDIRDLDELIVTNNKKYEF